MARRKGGQDYHQKDGNGEWMPNIIDPDQSLILLRIKGVANSQRGFFLYLHMCQKCHAFASDEAL
jgi:hypothetical protein